MLTETIRNLLNFSNKHHTYHYQEAYEHLLIAFTFIKLQNKENALKHIEKSFFHLPHGNNLAEFLQDFVNFHFYKQSNLLSSLQTRQNEEIFFKNNELQIQNNLKNQFGIYNTEIENLLLTQVNELFLRENFVHLSDLLIEINNFTAQKHFHYHCQLSDMYFEVAKESFSENLIHDAKYFINKALETDKRNLKNDEYLMFKKHLAGL